MAIDVNKGPLGQQQRTIDQCSRELGMAFSHENSTDGGIGNCRN